MHELDLESIKNNKCSKNFVNCEFEINLKEFPQKKQIKNFYIYLVNKNNGIYLAEKYPKL